MTGTVVRYRRDVGQRLHAGSPLHRPGGRAVLQPGHRPRRPVPDRPVGDVHVPVPAIRNAVLAGDRRAVRAALVAVRRQRGPRHLRSLRAVLVLGRRLHRPRRELPRGQRLHPARGPAPGHRLPPAPVLGDRRPVVHHVRPRAPGRPRHRPRRPAHRRRGDGDGAVPGADAVDGHGRGVARERAVRRASCTRRRSVA